MAYLPVVQETTWQQSDSIDLPRRPCLSLTYSEGRIPSCPSSRRWCRTAPPLRKPHVRRASRSFSLTMRIFPAWTVSSSCGASTASSPPRTRSPRQRLSHGASDYIIPKRRYDGFFQTDLDLTLRELGVDTLIVVGADTNICVLQTLAGAYFRGYKTVVAADATATFLIGTQEYALDYFSRCYDSRVVDTARVLAYLAD